MYLEKNLYIGDSQPTSWTYIYILKKGRESKREICIVRDKKKRKKGIRCRNNFSISIIH